MELRRYWSILRGRMWVVVVLTGLALVFSVVFKPEYPESYQAQVRLAVKPNSQTSAGGNYYSAVYYDYLASEYLVDDIAATVESGAFLADVQERLKDRPGGPPVGAITTKKMHRVLTIEVVSSRMADALDIARTAGEVLSEPEAKYWKQLGASSVDVAVIQPAVIVAAPGEKRTLLDIGVKTLLGLIVGVGLAFLLDYLDDTLQTRGDVEMLGLPLLGEVPRERRRVLGRQRTM